ncbi:hypothetical protein I0Q12_19235 [Rhodococcus sp. CX]|uniref:hypothetical protein n=1 Tax=Rhodococcus sp. CX TaxID=2789880 RepID=UPI0018CE4F09|nr:hypothetical protein [Rhodococcus sp. CX]MBH0121526.1 hypothetical protein [Rhodococcus sp. CX]
MSDVLAWIGAIGGLLGGGAGLGFGVSGFVQSRRANKIAQDARDFAESGHQLSSDANDLSREANRIAVDARQLAEEANTISMRAEARETEINDVRWVGAWKEPGRYILTNRGQDEAIGVNATVTVDGEEAHRRVDSVPAGGYLAFELPGARDQFRREQAEIAAYNRHTAAGRYAVYPIHMANTILERVVWVTPLGKERIHDIQSPISNLGEP